MKKVILAFCAMMLMVNLSVAQVLDKAAVTGKWEAVSVKPTKDNLPAEVQQMMAVMQQGFKGAVFHFKEDGSLEIELSANVPDMIKEMLQPIVGEENQLWKFDETKQVLSTGTKQHGYTYIIFHVRVVEGKTLFFFSDTPLVLEMSKEE